MKWRLIINLWIMMFALLPMTAVAEVTRAVISVDGMSCPFCAFGVEKKLKAVDGRFVRQYGKTWEKGIWAGSFNYPTDVTLDADNKLIVADAYNDRVQIFGSSGELLRKWGGPLAINIVGSSPGMVQSSHGCNN